MIKSFITKTRWLVTIILLTTFSVGQMWGATYTYRLVISKAALTDGGKYILLVNNRSTAYKCTVSSGHLQTGLTFSSSQTSAGSAVTTTNTADKIKYVTLIHMSGDKYKILDSDGKYITATAASSGNFSRADADSYGWTFYGTSGIDAIYERAFSSKYACIRSYNNGSFRSYQAANHTSASSSGNKIYLATGCTVIYDGNGSTSGTVPEDAYLYGEGHTVTVKSNSGTLAKTGYTFSGWNTRADGTGTNYTAGSGTFTVPSNTTSITLYAKWVSAAPACGSPTALTKGSFSGGNQNVSWTAPGSAPANGYLVAYSTTTSTAPADNVYSTNEDYTIVSVAAGTTNVNIPCTTTGTYNWWVRSKCSADNTSLSSWVPATGQSFTMTTVYLKNTVNWANAYVSFYSSSYWDASDGTGSSRASGSYVADPAAMTYTESTGLFSYICPSGYTYASFAKDKQDNYGNFYETEAIYCDNDFQFNKVVVPTTQSGTATHHSTKYYKTYTYETFDNGKGTGYYCAGDFNSFETLGNEFTIEGGVLTYTKTLSANTRYGFKVYHHGEYWRNSGGAFVHSIENWSMVNTDGYNTYFISGPAGTYTFTFDQEDHEVSVTYPDCGHPCANYAYFENTNSWSNVYAHIYDNSTSTPINAWHGVPLSLTQTICGHTYYYGAIECSNYDKVIYNDGGSNQIDAKNTSSCSGKHSDASTTAWTAFTTYTISYAAGDGGSGEMASHSGLCPGDNQALSPNIFTKDHYHFTSWKTNVAVTINTGGGDQNIDANGIVPGGATIKSIGSNVTLTAQWEINSNTLTWNWGGGSTSSTTYTLYPATSGSVNYGASITYPANGTMSKTGYNFSSWSSSATSMPDNDLTITANWTAKEYSVTLNREGASTGSTSVTMTYNSASHTAITAPSKTGYTFGGWYTGEGGTGTQVMNTSGTLQANVSGYTGAGGVWTKTTTPTTLYAKWTAKNYTVTLNDGSGSGGDGTVSVTYNSNTNISDVTVPTYTGNDFRGYYTSTGGSGTKVIDGNGAWIRGTSYVDASGNWVYDGSPTLHAYYTTYAYENYRTSCADQYNIVLDDGLVATTNNGSAKVADKGTTLTSIVAPTKSGYDIEGYYTTSGLNTKIATLTGALSASITVSGDAWTDGASKWVLGTGATFYTKWTAHEYTITYEGLEGASNTNPTSYNIETTTFALANPGSRTGYTFSGWTLGGTPITQITVGSTGDKTITANWSLNQHTVAVSAVDNVVITATPAGGAAIGESGSNTNVDYNKTITLGCTPDDHWNLAWDVYKTGESSTKVAVTGSGDGATFTMPDYNVTVTAVMTEDTYHTATFKNNGEVIDGYDEVKTYDGTRPSAPTLTDVTDACDKTDCNKFYGWIAEAGVWEETINSVAGKTIYRRASDIPNVSGADVVYHAVWAKGTGSPNIPNTLIAKWDKQSLTASTAVKAKDKDGNTLNSVTLTSNISMSTDGVYCKGADISTDPVITLAGLDFSDYDAGVITFFARGSQQAIITVDYSTDDGSSYSTDHFFDGTAKKEHGFAVTVPNTTTNVKISYGSNTGNFYFGTVRAYGTQTTSYDFTELTSSNTSGWSGADWDGYYLIVGDTKSKALRSDIMEGLDGLTTVSASEGVISTSNLGLIFKATYNSSTSKYAVRSAATQDYLTDAAGGASEAYHLLKTSAAEVVSIAYNDILNATGYYVRWNAPGNTDPRFGSYSSCTAPTLYKIMGSFTEFRVTCCATKVTLSQNSPEHGTIAFGKTTVPTCGEDKEVSLTITPAAGYQLATYSVATGDGKVATKTDPGVSLNNNSSAAQNLTLTFAEDANGAYDVTASFTEMVASAWTWTQHVGGATITTDPVEVYVGQKVQVDVSYEPAGLLSNHTNNSAYDYPKPWSNPNVGSPAKAGDHFTVTGTNAGSTSITLTHNDGLTKTIYYTVVARPLVHFVDKIHDETFADVVAAVSGDGWTVTTTLPTPTHSDVSDPGSSYNTCERQHLHLIGWIESTWADAHPEATASEIIAAGATNFYAAGADINLVAQDGKTFYAVWSIKQ